MFLHLFACVLCASGSIIADDVKQNHVHTVHEFINERKRISVFVLGVNAGKHPFTQ